MNSIHRQRMFFIGLFILSMALAVGLILYALKQNINLFYTPTEIVHHKIPLGHTIRVGGMVKKGSLKRGEHLNIQFTITDFHQELIICYTGILPDLFREGQGVVVLGDLNHSGYFQAYEVLAKHDENYMPPVVKAALERGDQKNAV